MTAETLREALATTGAVLANVSRDQFDRPTPCASWTVRDLVDHVVGATAFYASTAETGVAPRVSDGPDHAAGDFQAAFATGAARAVAAFSAVGAMEKPMKLPFGELRGSIYVLVAATDTFTHAWDLARATGQPTDLNPTLAAHLHAAVAPFLADGLRGADGERPFGPRVDVDDTASAADQLAAFMGRHP